MSQKSKREYLRKIYDRYQRAGRKYKSRILEEFCQNCDYHRKYALRLLNRPLLARQSKPGPKPKYPSDELFEPLKEIWLASDQLCSKLLKPALPLWLEYKPQWDEGLKAKLLQMSSSTIDRMLKAARLEHPGRRRLSKPGSQLRQSIPIRTSNEDIDRPGFMEVDTVAHCGGSLEGDIIWSVTYTDILTAWTEAASVWNRSADGVLQRTKTVQEKVPFKMEAFDSDNGGEFINHGLIAYLKDQGLRFTRARPYHKNDNAHVEQKNWMHVRQLLGYDRFEHAELVEPVNELYQGPWRSFKNFFCPTLKLESKERRGARLRKRYGVAQTPYERVMASEFVSAEKKAALRVERAKLNPFELKKEIEKRLRAIHALRRQLDRQTRKLEVQNNKRQFIALEPTLRASQKQKPDGKKAVRPVEIASTFGSTRRSGCAAAEPYPPRLRSKDRTRLDKTAGTTKTSSNNKNRKVTGIMSQRPSTLPRLR